MQRMYFSINVAVNLPDNVEPNRVGFFPVHFKDRPDGLQAGLQLFHLDNNGTPTTPVEGVKPLFWHDLEHTTEYYGEQYEVEDEDDIIRFGNMSKAPPAHLKGDFRCHD